MRIAITSCGGTLEDEVDPRFGRCACFLIVDTETMCAEAVGNPFGSAGGGAGVQSAQLVAEREVEAVLTGRCGPNASRALEAAGIETVQDMRGSVREAIEQFQADHR